jgi:benzoate membrane transport protein
MSVTVSKNSIGQNLTLSAAAVTAIVVGYASTILVVMEGLRAVGATVDQQASAAGALCLAMAATSFILAWRSRQPIMVAWSTPGAALMATGAAGITFPEAIGAFIFAGALMVLTALVRPLARAIEHMPGAIAAALLAGVLLKFVLGVPVAALASPFTVLPMVVAYFLARIFLPLYAVPIILVLGLGLAAVTGQLPVAPIAITPFTFTWPEFNPQVMLGLGVPLYLVTMASQNLPGFAVLRANGYQPDVSACLGVTGIGSMLGAFFGAHAVNMAAITASLVASPEAHPDPQERWKMIYPYVIGYTLVALASGTCVYVLGHLPTALITALAGLSLFGALQSGIAAMCRDTHDLDAALVTFLVAASGVTLFGIGSAFWGLLAGLLIWGTRHFIQKAT